MSPGMTARLGVVASLALSPLAVAPVAGSSVVDGVEVFAGADGPVAYRELAADGSGLLPRRDAVLIDEEWWSPLRPLADVLAPDAPPDPSLDEGIRARIAPAASDGAPDRLTAYAVGDVTLDGSDEVVVSFRRPFRPTNINMTRPRRAWVDDQGWSAHVGLYRPGDLSQVWVAGTLTSPVVALAACDGALAVAYGDLRAPGTLETGAWTWAVFGFLAAPPLPGPGIPACVDIDGDGRTEPAVLGRREP